MPEDPGQAPTSTPAQAATTAAGTAGAQQTAATAGGQEPTTFDAEYVRKLREEAAGYRTKTRELEDQVKTFQQRDLTEAQRLQQRADEAEKKAQANEARVKDTLLRLDVERQARKLSIVDEDAAYRLLDPTKIEYGDDGAPKNVEQLLKDLTTAKPYLIAQGGQQPPAAGASVTNPNCSGNAQGAVYTQAQLADRTFWEANRDAIMLAVREGRIQA